MSVAGEDQWSNGPNAPQIPYLLYFAEKSYFAGSSLGAIFYGTLMYAPAYPCLLCAFDTPF